MKTTNEQVAVELYKNNGNISATARAIGVSWTAIHKRIQKSKPLQRVKEETKESKLDAIEEKAMELVEKGNPGMIIYLLSTLGKHRGYTPKVDVSVINQEALEAAHDRMREFYDERK